MVVSNHFAFIPTFIPAVVSVTRINVSLISFLANYALILVQHSSSIYNCQIAIATFGRNFVHTADKSITEDGKGNLLLMILNVIKWYNCVLCEIISKFHLSPCGYPLVIVLYGRPIIVRPDKLALHCLHQSHISQHFHLRPIFSHI